MKRTYGLLKLAAYVLLLLAVNIVGTATAAAQCQGAGLQRALVDPTTNTISLELNPRITDKDQAVAQNPLSWTIVDITPPSPTPAVSPVRAPTTTTPRVTSVELGADRLFPNNFLSALLDYQGTFEAGHQYILSNVRLTFNGCAPSQPPFTLLLFKLTEPPVFVSRKANGRQDADIYVEGQLEGARKSRAKQTIDVKVQLPISVKSFLGRQRDFVPFFDLKASNSKKADADSLKFGGMLRTNYNFEHLGLTNLSWETDGRIEADRKFDNVNAVWGNTLYFIPPLLGQSSNNKMLVYLQPFIGAELGRNLKSPVKEAEHRGIARATTGASLYLLFATGNKYLDSLSLQTDYVRRWPLRREVSFTEDDNGKLLPLFIGRSPRDYVASKVEYSVNDFFGLAVGYTYGSLPPNFKLVDSRYTFGFTYKKQLIPRLK
jgi:hypothetical protein